MAYLFLKNQSLGLSVVPLERYLETVKICQLQNYHSLRCTNFRKWGKSLDVFSLSGKPESLGSKEPNLTAHSEHGLETIKICRLPWKR